MLLVVAACGDDDSSGSTPSSDGSSSPEQGGELVIGRTEPHSSWNPFNTVSGTDLQTYNFVTESLLLQDPETGLPMPGIGESWEFSEDNKVLTVKIREGVKFSDGTPVTAEDVVFSFNFLHEPTNLLYYMTAHVSTAEVSADGTSVVFTSEQPNTFILAGLTEGMGVYPKDFGGQTPEEFFLKPIGAGPFMIESEDVGVSLTLTRNEHYWREDKPGLDKVTINVIPDANQRQLQFEQGDLDMIEDEAIDAVRNFDDGAVTIFTSSGQRVLSPNQGGQPILKDPTFRRALALALNRDELSAGPLNGALPPSTHVLPTVLPDQADAPTVGSWDVYDPEEARQLVEDSGYAGETLKFIVNAGQGTNPLVNAIVQQLSDVGVNAEVVPLETQQYFDSYYGPDYQGGDYDLALTINQASAPSAIEPISVYATYGFLWTRGPVDQAQQWFDELVGVSNDEIAAAIPAIEDIIYEEALLIPVVQDGFAYAIGPDLRGLQVNPIGIFDIGSLSVG